MSNNDNFGSGFILGTIVGSALGALVGTVIAQQKDKAKTTDNQDDSPLKTIKYTVDNQEDVLETKIDLEDKINQLNHAIDQVRCTLLKDTEKVNLVETLDREN